MRIVFGISEREVQAMVSDARKEGETIAIRRMTDRMFSKHPCDPAKVELVSGASSLRPGDYLVSVDSGRRMTRDGVITAVTQMHDGQPGDYGVTYDDDFGGHSWDRFRADVLILVERA